MSKSAIVPPSRPKIARARVEADIQQAGLGNQKVVLVGYRGYYEDTMGKPDINDWGIYDDCIVLVTPTAYYAVNANTDPSRYSETVAQLVPGVHWYKKGRHGISRGAGYPALRPATKDEALSVRRGGESDDGHNINIHRGGYNSTSSEGCQTVWPDQWDIFISLVYDQMDDYNVRKIPYLLMMATG